MKKLFLSLLVFASVYNVHAQKAKKAIFVIVDGIAADVIEKQPTPNLDKISKVGGYTRAHVGGEKGGYSQTPTISAVGYNSLLTGTWVNKHNVWDNDIADPNYNYWTLFRFFNTQYPDKKTAIFSSWLDNRTKLVGDGLPQTGHLKIDYHFDGLENDTVQYPHDREKYYMHLIDEAVVEKASSSIRDVAPDLSWVYLEYTDDMGHRYGDSEAFHKAVAYMDQQMGKLWEAIQYRQQKFQEDWVIYITTDHGRDSATGKHHGGQSDRERSTWIVTNAQGLNTHFKSGKAAVVDIMPSIARFLDLTLPKEQAMEIDGIPLVGPVSIRDAKAHLSGNTLELSWEPISSNGQIEVFVAGSNNFKTGQRDAYTHIKTVPVVAGKIRLRIPSKTGTIKKVVLQAPNNSLNRWIIN